MSNVTCEDCGDTGIEPGRAREERASRCMTCHGDTGEPDAIFWMSFGDWTGLDDEPNYTTGCWPMEKR
jgi:DnaJ-class molecular chaperone